MSYKGKFLVSISLFATFIVLILTGNGFSISTVSVNAEPEIPTVIIDAGHGGFDPGAIVGNILEKDINLCIAWKLYTCLSSLGIETYMTRTNDSSTGPNKAEDLQARVSATKTNKNCILVSIHQNMFSVEKYSGAQMFYGSGNGSIFLAEQLRNSVIEYIQPENTRLTKSGESLYILSKSNCPSVMVECGFMSNNNELKKLTDSEYQNRLAFAIAVGINKYIIEEYCNV